MGGARQHLWLSGIILLLIVGHQAVSCSRNNRAPRKPRPHWRDAGTREIMKRYHTAVLLHDGRVLLCGGGGWNVATDTCRTYDYQTNRWGKAPSLLMRRVWHTAVVLKDGRVLVVGGTRTGDYKGALSSTEIYDPRQNRWLRGDDMALPREGHTATLLTNGDVLVVGGEPPAAEAVTEIYDSRRGRWRLTTPLPHETKGHTATLLADGRVLVIGKPTGLPKSNAHIFDPKNETWRKVATPSSEQTLHTATLLANGKVLVVGGYHRTPVRAEIYDPRADAWLPAAQPDGRYNHRATLLPDGRVLVVGGTDWTVPDPDKRCPKPIIYDPESDSWTAEPLPPMLTVSPPNGHSLTLLPDGTVLVGTTIDRPVRWVGASGR